VQDNYFHKEGTGFGDVGMFIFGTQSSSEIYNNTFTNMPTSGFVALDRNNVKLTCNRFGSENEANGNIFDISVLKYQYPFSQPPLLKNSYIAQFQGLPASPFFPGISAKNQFFTNRCELNTGQNAFFTNPEGTNPNYKYVYNAGVSGSSVNWTDFIGCFSNTFIQKTSITQPLIVVENCPPSIEQPVIPINIGNNRLSQINTEIQTNKTELHNLIDNGNTSLLLDMIQNATNGNFKILCNKLLEASPYLSDTVLLTFMRDQKQYNPPNKTNVLLANSPLPDIAKAEIDGLALPQHFINILKQYQIGINQRVQKEIQFENLVIEKEQLISTLIEQSLRDTSSEKLDSVVNLLQTQTDLQSKLTLISLLTGDSRYNDATSAIILALPFINDLTSEKQEEFSNYLNLLDFHVALVQLPDSVQDSIVSENSTFLYNFASFPGYGSIDAQLLLEKANVKDYYEIIDIPMFIDAKYFTQPTENISTNNGYSEVPETVQIYPNPVTDKVIVQYSFQDEDISYFIQLFSCDGKLLLSLPLRQQIGLEEIEINGFNPGNYILTIRNAIEIKHIEKITINK